MQFQVKKRNGRGTEVFEEAKIRSAVEKAGREIGYVWGETQINKVIVHAMHVLGAGRTKTTFTVEQIQDAVEKGLMEAGAHEVAKAYILFRAKRSEQRASRYISEEERAAVAESRAVFKTDLEYFQMADKYARWLDDKKRRETWTEIVDRVVGFLKWQVNKIGKADAVKVEEWKDLWGAIYNREAMPSMRLMQMAGPAAMRCNVCIYNCAVRAMDSWKAFGEMLYISCSGTGISFSVEGDWVGDLPKIKRQKGGDLTKVVVPDSTEGWADSVVAAMEIVADGGDVDLDTTQVRAAGSRLKTKGGRASGPEPLRRLIAFIVQTMKGRQGRRLRTIDVHDICCLIAEVGELGGVRRAASLSASDLDDTLMRDAKNGTFFMAHGHRRWANNSAVYEQRPSDVEFMEEWMNLAKSGSGERGILNRYGANKQIPKRRKKARFLVNPCGEIFLRPDGQFCNLTTTPIRVGDNIAEIERKVRLSAILGTIQATMTDFKYLGPQWKKNCEDEALLGVDLAGALDNQNLQFDGLNGVRRHTRQDLLEFLRQAVIDTNVVWAERLGIKPSAATTCIKPGGNSSVFLNLGNSISGRFAPFIVRRVRVNAVNPMSKFLIDAGVPHHPEYGSPDPKSPSVWVFEFLWESPQVGQFKDDFTAIDLLENWLDFKTHFTEHNPSATIYIGADEWVQAGAWVLKHFDQIGGLAFLPRDDTVYPLAPMEAVSEERFRELEAKFPKIDWSKLARYEHDDETDLSSAKACVGGACEI